VPIGILTDRDVLKKIVDRPEIWDDPVSTVMTKTVIVGSPQDDVEAVMKTMTEKRFRHLPVMEHGKLIGIVSIGDMVKAQVDQYRGEIETLETQMIGG